MSKWGRPRSEAEKIFSIKIIEETKKRAHQDLRGIQTPNRQDQGKKKKTLNEQNEGY